MIAGTFTDTHTGLWLVTKLFFGDDEAEVFLAINAVEKRALLIPKDPEYNERAVEELAKVI